VSAGRTIDLVAGPCVVDLQALSAMRTIGLHVVFAAVSADLFMGMGEKMLLHLPRRNAKVQVARAGRGDPWETTKTRT